MIPNETSKIILLWLLFFLVSCAGPQNQSPVLFKVPGKEPFPIKPKAQTPSPQIPSPQTLASYPPNVPEAKKKFIPLNPAQKPPKPVLARPEAEALASQKIYNLELDLENADLLEFLEFIFLKTLKKNYTVDPTIKSKIFIHLKGTFSEKELIHITKKVLELQNIAVIAKNRIYYITSTVKLGKFSGAYSFLIYRPKYLQVSNLVNLARSFASQQAVILPDRQTETIIIVDNPENLKKMEKIFKILDRNFLVNFFIEIYRPEVLDAETLTKYLIDILKSRIFKDNSLTNYVDFVPLKEINSLIIIAKQKEFMDTIKHWIIQLDSGETIENQVFVYYVENGDAEEIAKILQNTFSETQMSQRETIIKAKAKKKGTSLSGKVKIIPDKTNNVLIIVANPDDYKTIIKLLKDIDIIPRQVLIEVIIAEVSLNKNLEYGVEWWIKTNFKLNSRRYEGKIVSINNYSGSAGKGFSFTVFRGIEPRALLAALDEVSEVHILSNPVILATDNKEAKIQIGEEVPTISQSLVNTSATTPNITQNIQYRDVGIILKVKPHINSSGLVKLDIMQEISSVSDKVVQGISSPVFTKRKVETSLVVQDGQTIILGGLIQNQHNRNEVGVPLFKDIPAIGNLFKWHGTKKDRKELLIAITPKVIRNVEETNKVMSEYKERINELKELLAKEFKNFNKYKKNQERKIKEKIRSN